MYSDDEKEDTLIPAGTMQSSPPIDNLDDYHNDSSDEESDFKQFGKYNFPEKIFLYDQKSQKSGSNEYEFLQYLCIQLVEIEKKKGIIPDRNNILREAHLMSMQVMLVHCIGQAIPHADGIRSRYYKKKSKLGVREKKLSDIEKLLTEALKNTVLILDSNAVGQFLSDNKQLISNTSNIFRKNPLIFMREARYFHEYTLPKSRFPFSDAFKSILLEIEYSLFNLTKELFKEKYKSPKEPYKPEKSRVMDFMVEQLMQLSIEKGHDIFGPNGRFKRNKEAIEQAMDDITSDLNVPGYLKTVCYSVVAIAVGETLYNSNIRDFIVEDDINLTIESLQEEEEKGYQIELSKHTETSKKDKSSIKSSSEFKFTLYPAAAILDHKDRLSNNPMNFIHFFMEKFIESLVQNYFWENRPVLPIFYQFNHTSVSSSMVNTRLSNRSMRRQILNNSYKLDSAYSFTRVWQKKDKSEAVTERFSLNLNGTREDYVDMPFVADKFDSYVNLASSMDKLKDALNAKSDQKITDKEIALWIRLIYQGEKNLYVCDEEGNKSDVMYVVPASHKKILLHALLALVVLLLQNECSRNSSAYICNQMFLDLVQFGHLKWKQISVWMPMAMKSAIEGARFLNHQLFDSYMPFYSRYPGPEAKPTAKRLFFEEADLIRLWCNRFFKEGNENQQLFILKIHDLISQQWYKGIKNLSTSKVCDLIKQGQFKKAPVKDNTPKSISGTSVTGQKKFGS